MTLPKMILFDYGQTLMTEGNFDALAGDEALLRYADNPAGVTAAEVQALADAMVRELRGLDSPDWLHTHPLEVHNRLFNRYLYEYLGITLRLSPLEAEELFWDTAAPAEPAEGIRELLEWLRRAGIRTGVISNISFSGEALERRIRRAFPEHPFEWILASSEYLFRKPSRRIFGLALRRAGLSPSDIWFCGDNPVCDVEGASAAGMFPVWYRGALLRDMEAPSVSHLSISSWAELHRMLEQGKIRA